MQILTKYQARIDYWESKGLRKSKPGTKTFENNLENLKDSVKGTGAYVGCPISMPKFRLAVDRFAETVFNNRYRPVDKSKIRSMSLGDFIYNKWSADPRFKRSLEYFTENQPEPIFTIPNTKLYDSLCQSYVSMNGLGDVNQLTLDQLDNISLASHKLWKFFKIHQDKVDSTYIQTDKDKTDLFIRHVLDQLKGNIAKFNTRALTYNSVWEMLPNFFKQHGYFTTTKRKTMAQIEESIRDAKRTSTRPTLKRRGKRV